MNGDKISKNKMYIFSVGGIFYGFCTSIYIPKREGYKWKRNKVYITLWSFLSLEIQIVLAHLGIN